MLLNDAGVLCCWVGVIGRTQGVYIGAKVIMLAYPSFESPTIIPILVTEVGGFMQRLNFMLLNSFMQRLNIMLLNFRSVKVRSFFCDSSFDSWKLHAYSKFSSDNHCTSVRVDRVESKHGTENTAHVGS
jgi:hypothetical protein